MCGNQLNDQLTLKLEDCPQGKGGCGAMRGGIEVAIYRENGVKGRTLPVSKHKTVCEMQNEVAPMHYLN